MANDSIVSFAPNIPQQLSLRETEGQLLSGRFSDQVYYQLSDGRGLVVDTATATKINLLELQPGEPFSICKQWDGNPRHPQEWSVWLTPHAEKARAAAEDFSGTDLEEQLRLSIEQAKAKIPRRPPTPERTQPQAIRKGTGTDGPAPQPHAQPVLIPEKVKPTITGKIPYNVAFREILQFVTTELKCTGEQWNDQAKQDLVSTALIGAQKAGYLTMWEREVSK